MSNPAWLNKETPTRKRSGKQEKALREKFGGKLASNSGARFGENDIKSEDMEIEAKTTQAIGYRLTIKELDGIEKKCKMGKIPVQVIQFEQNGKSYAVLPLTEFEALINRGRSNNQ